MVSLPPVNYKQLFVIILINLGKFDFLTFALGGNIIEVIMSKIVHLFHVGKPRNEMSVVFLLTRREVFEKTKRQNSRVLKQLF
jgi:hypothetical protein